MPKPQDKNIQIRTGEYLKDNDLLLKKHKLIMRLVINFPRRIKPPLLSRIALWIVTKQGGQIDIQFAEVK